MTFEERRQAALKYVKDRGLRVIPTYPRGNVEYYGFLTMRDFRCREFFKGGWA